MVLSRNSVITDVNYDALIQELEASVKRNLADGLLLSGGLDTSILACLAAKWGKPDCITVALKNASAPDIEYARKIADLFKLNHYVHYFGQEELEDGIQSAVTVLKSFDPMEIRNSAAAYVALRLARDRGSKSVMTGDGGDELFAGYSFFFDLSKEQLDSELKKMWENMRFSSIDLARSLGIEAKLPMLDPEFKSLAMNLDSSLKIQSENGRIFGKWILRKAFEKILSPEVVWRVKAPLEVGTGTTVLPVLFDSIISDTEFNIKKVKYLEQDRVKIRTKEHLYYYETYRKIIGIPSSLTGKGRKCPECRANVKERAEYCPTCGAYPLPV